jgi:hypothetical protein
MTLEAGGHNLVVTKIEMVLSGESRVHRQQCFEAIVITIPQRIEGSYFILYVLYFFL